MKPLRSRPYLKWIESLICDGCGSAMYPRVAHHIESAGTALKCDDVKTIPLCVTTPNREGCHERYHRTGLISIFAGHTASLDYAYRRSLNHVTEYIVKKGIKL